MIENFLAFTVAFAASFYLSPAKHGEEIRNAHIPPNLGRFPMSKLTPEQGHELWRLERERRLDAENILELAADPETALHSRFTWDDTAAAAQYRLWEARHTIRIHVRQWDVG